MLSIRFLKDCDAVVTGHYNLFNRDYKMYFPYNKGDEELVLSIEIDEQLPKQCRIVLHNGKTCTVPVNSFIRLEHLLD